jgi:hypothetical protein
MRAFAVKKSQKNWEVNMDEISNYTILCVSRQPLLLHDLMLLVSNTSTFSTPQIHPHECWLM